MSDVCVEDVIRATSSRESQDSLDDLVGAREDVSDLLSEFNHAPDVLALHVKVLRDERDIVYLVNQENEEFSYLLPGFVSYASMATNLKDKLRRPGFKIGGVLQRLSLIGGGQTSFENAMSAMRALYSYLSTSTGPTPWKELYMAPFGDVPAVNAITPLFAKRGRNGFVGDPCIPIPSIIDPDGSVKNAADRWNLDFTEENVVILKKITKVDGKLTTVDVDPSYIKVGQLVEARISFRGYKRNGVYWFKCKLNSVIVYSNSAVKSLDDLTATREAQLSMKRKSAYDAHPVKKRKHCADIVSTDVLNNVSFLQKASVAMRRVVTPSDNQMDMDGVECEEEKL